MISELISGLIPECLSRLGQVLLNCNPIAGKLLLDWTHSLAPHQDVSRYFLHPEAFPTLLLPAFVAEESDDQQSFELLRDLTYSSICGYYLIRMVDNICDEPGSTDLRLLPMTTILQSEFQDTYFKWFPKNHEFWDKFKLYWYETACNTVLDSRLTEISKDVFEGICSRKVLAALIPMQASSMILYGRELEPEWIQCFHTLASMHQMQNDVFDFHRDFQSGRQTWFLSYCRQQANVNSSTLKYIASEGFHFGIQYVENRLHEAMRSTCAERSPSLSKYIQGRLHDLEKRTIEIHPTLEVLNKLFNSSAPRA